MGFLQPSPPPFDLQEWKQRPYLARLKANAQDWAVNGFGTPTAVFLAYVMKLVVFTLGAFLVIGATTPGLGGIGDFADWWSEPIVFQKLALWTLLWEICGLGSGSMPLTFRFWPPIGGILYWLRPRTVRLPPWPDKVPLTSGNRRSIVDVVLYVGVLASGIYLLFSDGEDVAGLAAGRLEPVAIAVLLGLLALLGLRDKVSFLASRPEIYGFMLAVSLFPVEQHIAAWQFVFFFIWWGAATSKLNRHFPYVISVMISNTPWNRSRKAKAKLYEDYPEDLRPSRHSAFAAHLGTAVEYTLPLLLLATSGGPIGTFAVIGMIIFHVHITSTFPLGVPLEWNIFMIFGILFLFAENGDVPLSTLDNPLLIALLVAVGVILPIIGNLRPDKVSFLPGMRYYAGNWATSMWLFRKETEAEARLDGCVYKVAPVVLKQLERFYDRETASYMLEKGLSFRAMHSHGRALNGLMPRAVEDPEAYDIREGELIAGVVAGWNFGDGHFHHAQLLEAVQEQCGFAEGDVRVIALEGQPIQVQRQRYRIFDAARGLLEEGFVDVADMVERGPWLEERWDFPAEVVRSERPSASAAPGPGA